MCRITSLWMLAMVVPGCAELAQRANGATTGLTVEIFSNTVMRGSPRCTVTLPNSFNHSLTTLCPKVLAQNDSADAVTARITATLDPLSDGWRRFSADVDQKTWIRLWVDDHRIIDAWGPHSDPSPVTHSLLPNVSLSAARRVFVRVDLRPWSPTLAFGLNWMADKDDSAVMVPMAALSPEISNEQKQRRLLQERAATGWNQWIRSSNLAQVVLPQQVGIDLGVLNVSSGKEYRKGLLNPQFHGAPAVRMGHHAFDGTFTSVSFIIDDVNFTVESAVIQHEGLDHGSQTQPDNVVVVKSNATKESGLELVVHPGAFWGAQADISITTNPAGISLNCGELGTLSVTFSQQPTIVLNEPPQLHFAVQTEPIEILLTFGPPRAAPSGVTADKILEVQRNAVFADIQKAADLSTSSFDVVDAMFTAIAWNVNFDPRVAVTVPVSRTFEAGFDFIFFDWDMYFLSLMASSLPAAANSHAFTIGISNLIEVTQTRSAYGQVMNKRAAAGSSSSDSNDRTEPYVGSTITLRLLQDARGTDREATMLWVTKLLFPTLLRWNQWAWQERRYFGAGSGRGLFVLGSDNNQPCEGSTVGLNTSRTKCGSIGNAILESGMDNSPMYYHTWDNTSSAGGKGDPASYDTTANRLQLYDVQMSSLFVAESVALQSLAAATNNTESIADLKKQSDMISAQINSVLWDDKTGIYRQVDASSEQRGFSPRLSPTSFYPMIGGVASSSQVTRLVNEHLVNPNEFCVDPNPQSGSASQCPFALPSISRNDPSFFDNSYWAGRTWGPLNLLVWIGLSNPKYTGLEDVNNARRGLCLQSQRLLLHEFMRNRHVHENYNSTNGNGGDVTNSNPFYHWGALLGYIGLRENLMHTM